jgi:hypothetical protein
VARQVQESRKEAAAEKADRTRDKVSQSLEDAKDKAKDKIDEVKSVIQPEIRNRGSRESTPSRFEK